MFYVVLVWFCKEDLWEDGTLNPHDDIDILLSVSTVAEINTTLVFGKDNIAIWIVIILYMYMYTYCTVYVIDSLYPKRWGKTTKVINQT